jgi:hypothetical protein
MGRKLIEMLERALAAERYASELRSVYGARAEHVCDALIATHRAKGPEGEQLKDVRRALRWL